MAPKPIGLAALLTAQLYSPSAILMIDLDGNRLLTTPLLLRLMKAGKLRPAGLVAHRFGLDEIMQAYDTFADAAKTSALKVVLKGRGPD